MGIGLQVANMAGREPASVGARRQATKKGEAFNLNKQERVHLQQHLDVFLTVASKNQELSLGQAPRDMKNYLHGLAVAEYNTAIFISELLDEPETAQKIRNTIREMKSPQNSN